MSLIKEAHRMWHDYQFIQQNKAAKKHKGIGFVWVGVYGVGESWSKLGGSLHKLGGRNPLPTMASA